MDRAQGEKSKISSFPKLRPSKVPHHSERKEDGGGGREPNGTLTEAIQGPIGREGKERKTD